MGAVQAPGYSQVIKRPMSFMQVRKRLEKYEYSSWQPVQEDLETMFNNAMVYNPPTSPYHLKVCGHPVFGPMSISSMTVEECEATQQGP